MHHILMPGRGVGVVGRGGVPVVGVVVGWGGVFHNNYDTYMTPLGPFI